jgi:hypothetical protein
MNMIYSCPHCKAMLNPEKAVILLASHDGVEHLAGFHPQPGNYEMYLPSGTEPQPGDTWSFACPVCRKDLVADFSESLCVVDLISESESHRVFFSLIAGEQATFVVNEKGTGRSHGEHAERYSNEMAQMKYLL